MKAIVEQPDEGKQPREVKQLAQQLGAVPFVQFNMLNPQAPGGEIKAAAEAVRARDLAEDGPDAMGYYANMLLTGVAVTEFIYLTVTLMINGFINCVLVNATTALFQLQQLMKPTVLDQLGFVLVWALAATPFLALAIYVGLTFHAGFGILVLVGTGFLVYLFFRYELDEKVAAWVKVPMQIFNIHDRYDQRYLAQGVRFLRSVALVYLLGFWLGGLQTMWATRGALDAARQSHGHLLQQHQMQCAVVIDNLHTSCLASGINSTFCGEHYGKPSVANHVCNVTLADQVDVSRDDLQAALVRVQSAEAKSGLSPFYVDFTKVFADPAQALLKVLEEIFAPKQARTLAAVLFLFCATKVGNLINPRATLRAQVLYGLFCLAVADIILFGAGSVGKSICFSIPRMFGPIDEACRAIYPEMQCPATSAALGTSQAHKLIASFVREMEKYRVLTNSSLSFDG